MLNEALLFLLDILLQPFAAILLLRFHLQWLRAPLRNPIGEFIMVLTDFLVLRARRFVPSVLGLDSASLLLALLVEMLYLAGFLWAQGLLLHGFPLPGLLVLAAVKLPVPADGRRIRASDPVLGKSPFAHRTVADRRYPAVPAAVTPYRAGIGQRGSVAAAAVHHLPAYRYRSNWRLGACRLWLALKWLTGTAAMQILLRLHCMCSPARSATKLPGCTAMHSRYGWLHHPSKGAPTKPC